MFGLGYGQIWTSLNEFGLEYGRKISVPFSSLRVRRPACSSPWKATPEWQPQHRQVGFVGLGNRPPMWRWRRQKEAPVLLSYSSWWPYPCHATGTEVLLPPATPSSPIFPFLLQWDQVVVLAMCGRWIWCWYARVHLTLKHATHCRFAFGEARTGAHVGLADSADGDGRPPVPAIDEQMIISFSSKSRPKNHEFITNWLRYKHIFSFFFFCNHNMLNTVCALCYIKLGLIYHVLSWIMITSIWCSVCFHVFCYGSTCICRCMRFVNSRAAYSWNSTLLWE